jgi:peptide/nickel transport system ATP-binding protein
VDILRDREARNTEGFEKAAMKALMRVDELSVFFHSEAGTVKAVDGISFTIDPGEVFGLVGESGAGKSMTGRALLRLIPENGVLRGKIQFRGRDLVTMSNEEIRKIRGKEITIIQQDPLSSLNPAFKIRDQMTDVMKLHLGYDAEKAEKYALQLLTRVGISDPISVLSKFPHQLSGGMLQRVMIAIAFSCKPSLTVADEPTTALDVITQALVIKLMKEMRAAFNTSIVFITHNLSLAARFCDRIAVMYAGKIVEVGQTSQIFRSPQHPYTKALLAAIPDLTEKKRLMNIEGNMPSLLNPPDYCRYYPRCQFHMDKCREGPIPFFEIRGGGRAACLLLQESAVNTSVNQQRS